MTHTLHVLGQSAPVAPRETVLDAALRAGIAFPHGCRVGGCGSCKCKLVEGRVHELTETAYLLTKDELDRGVILACQSVPTTDVTLALEEPATSAVATITGQTKVTADITHLTLTPDTPLWFRAGQLVDLTLASLPGVTRSYSLAAPPRADGTLELYIRRVPGGRLSTHVDEASLLGSRATLGAPRGDFWLRDGSAPLVFVAGGSGLAPILAMLEGALEAADGDLVPRPATLVFGARTAADLYALDRIERIAAAWPAPFTFVPVLSDPAPVDTGDASWTGQRGLVTDVLPPLVPPGAHAYLCGPPAMLDACIDVLTRAGVARSDVRFDRFATRADELRRAPDRALPPVVVSETPPWSMVLHYLKFAAFHAIGLVSLATLLAGGAWTSIGLAVVLATYVLGDTLLGDDTSTPTFAHPRVLTAQLWLALPLLAAIVLASVWSFSTGDPLSIGALVHALTGFDALAARDATAPIHHVSAWVITGLMIGMVGTIPAHELTHRTWDPISMFVGRWLLAFSFDTSFAIEHVYGHHRYVSTTEDPATAPRGRSVYAHIVISTIRGHVSAFHIEAARLEKRSLPVLSLHNAVLRGYAMSALLVLAAYAMGGLPALAYFVACALWGKALLEIVNYMEHYGMVRVPSEPVAPRHSWNSNRRVSSWAMFNLTRHSHHHAEGEVPYHALRPYPDAPMMIGGYLTTILVALVPPLWHHLMTPKVLAWDREHASEAERRLAREANARSGRHAFARVLESQPS